MAADLRVFDNKSKSHKEGPEQIEYPWYRDYRYYRTW